MTRFGLLLKYDFMNILRSRWVIAYTILFSLVTEGFLQFGSDPSKVVASLMSVVLLVIPMVSILYTSVAWYSSEGFTCLLLSQPIPRGRIYLSRWLATSGTLSLSFAIGTAVPLSFAQTFDRVALLLIILAAVLTYCFVGLGLFASILVQDRMKGVGLAFIIWFYFAVVHDALVFVILSALREYPMEVPAMFMIGINPVDLSRMSLLLCLDFSALMGYTGTILQKSLSSALGYVLITISLLSWTLLPAWFGLRAFQKRDF